MEEINKQNSEIIQDPAADAGSNSFPADYEKIPGGCTGKGFLPGKSGNPFGRKPDTPEQKVFKKAVKQLIAEYKEGLADALVKIQPVLIAKALEGDVPAIREIHDRVMDKAKQPTELSGKEDAPVVLQISKEIASKNNLIDDDEQY